ncbi:MULTISPECIES: Cro/CI family transcriptional regulator [Aeromonas]|jgi:hypothetical protein|uniref:Cro/CI family transcriptional regulator n=1 Tax=Aeromonas TaxID=642 RepID=UPI000CDDC093|nr:MULTISPECIES: Cro/CI family transcriptional regulator [Aeromonas]POV91557.1 hypothetical protein C3418_12325 [Aeromonas sp. ASNIH8]
MRKHDAITHFGGVTATAKALGISHAAVVKWGDTIPQGRAYQIEVLTGGALKADPAAPSGQQRPYQRVAPGTPLEAIPSVQRATAAAKADPTNAQPGKA